MSDTIIFDNVSSSTAKCSREPGQSHYSIRHHQPGRSERIGQDYADEPHDWPSAAFPGSISVCGLPEGPGEVLPFDWLLHAVRFVPEVPGFDFVYSFLRLFGQGHAEAARQAWASIERVNMTEAARRKIAGYSKGMRQRIKLAQAISHDPKILILDEPLNGLDPLVRAETIALFRDLAQAGRHVIISSHVLHEVDIISDQVILMSSGYVVAEGQIKAVREEIEDHPMQILIAATSRNPRLAPLRARPWWKRRCMLTAKDCSSKQNQPTGFTC
jgi:ABC-type dipeptide/oligopeptide/nickel transport system ATPase component